MSEILPKNATRRFLDLQVGEVSLVDTAANEQVFLVAKRYDQDPTQEDNDMTQAAAPQAATGDGDGAARVPVDVTKAENQAVQAVMNQVTSLVDGIAKAAGVNLADEPEGGDEPSEVSTEKAGMSEMRKLYESEMKAAGMKGDKLKKAMDSFDKRFGKTPPYAKTQKSAEGGEGGDEGEATADPAQTLDDTVSATLDTIQKAKAFTPARITKLTEAMETLQKLMMEVIEPGMSPKTKAPGVNQHSNPNTTRSALVGTKKSADGGEGGEAGMADVLKGLDSVLQRMEEIVSPKDAPVSKSKNSDNGTDIVATLKSIQGRLDAIESARPASQSEGDGTGTTTTNTQKAFWGGII